jgi:hypothetical protein
MRGKVIPLIVHHKLHSAIKNYFMQFVFIIIFYLEYYKKIDLNRLRGV